MVDAGEYVYCAYCQSQFVPQADDRVAKATSIEIESDIERLLRMCREDPLNRHRYASLVLDIDPTNQDVIQYLR